MTRKPRKSVPMRVQVELWARAAGRCEFRGCNKLVFRDGLTKQRSNLSVVSHIVAYWPGGPRGDDVRSPQLCQDINNLMLTCRDHSKLIDDAALVAEYPEERLLEFKREHEERIARLTGITSEAQTRILILEAPVNGHAVAIPEVDTVEAVLPRYPADERAFRVNLDVLGSGICDPAMMTAATRAIDAKLQELERLQDQAPVPLSVFAIAPIPLLVYLGRRLGDTGVVEAFQRHRSSQKWSWPASEELDSFYTRTEVRSVGSREAAVVLSVSGAVSLDAVKTLVPGDAGIVELRARRRGLDFLRSQTRLEAFALEARKLMEELHEQGVRTIHVFAAAPAPVAVEFGRAARKLNGQLLVYEYDEGANAYGQPLQL